MEDIIKTISIDIGSKNPGIAILYYNKTTKIIEFAKLLKNENWSTTNNIVKSLDYILKDNNVSNSDISVIERQHHGSLNKDIMNFIYGYMCGKGIKTYLEQPISKLRKNKSDKRRVIKKQFSIDIMNKLNIYNNKLNFSMKNKDSDICDAFTIGYMFLFRSYISKNKTLTEDSISSAIDIIHINDLIIE